MHMCLLLEAYRIGMSFTAFQTGGSYENYHDVQIGYNALYGAITNSEEGKLIRVAKLHDRSMWPDSVEDDGYGKSYTRNTGIEMSTSQISGYASGRSSTGTTSKSSVIQPYITVFFWKRVQ